jgi:hypothetical protein
MELKLEVRRPRWWEKKWKPKKPILYIIEQVSGKWVNTYWWEGNWRNGGRIKFTNSGTARIGTFFGSRSKSDHVWLVVGRSGTTLTVDNVPLAMEKGKIKSLNPNTSEWTCFGKISALGIFTAEVSPFDLIEKIKES